MKWNLSEDIHMKSIILSRSFTTHHRVSSVVYPNYVNFQTLHKRFFTNDNPYEIGIKNGKLFDTGMSNTGRQYQTHTFNVKL